MDLKIHLENLQKKLLEETEVFLPVDFYFAKRIYPNNLKNWNFGCAKVPSLNDHKRPHISNIGSFMIVQSRELSRQPKSNSSGGLGILITV